MELYLDVPITVEIHEGGETRSIEITVRSGNDLLGREVAAEATRLRRTIDRLASEAAMLAERKAVARDRGDHDTLERLIGEEERLTGRLDVLTEEAEKLSDDSIFEEIAVKRFNYYIGGQGAPRLRQVAEKIGYRTVMDLVLKERDRVEKKLLSGQPGS